MVPLRGKGMPEDTGNEMIDRVINSRGFDNFDFRFIGLIFVILGIGVLSI